CLVNFYGEGARMGLHQDRDEASFDWPVISVSLGDEGLFRIGGGGEGGSTGSGWAAPRGGGGGAARGPRRRLTSDNPAIS
uniref:alpha-ketoglutarate-dependent dioxygenase AlkB n=1 Tax=Oceaniglobus roseus TaxID=1737570 RepID=UPI001561DD07